MSRENDLPVLLDLMAVRPDGDPTLALVKCAEPSHVSDAQTDVLVVGGGTGGVAAALAAGRAGRTVVLLEETDWIGGQMTAQGISALDEHEHIEQFGGTRTYYVGSSRVDLQACKLEYSIVSPK